MSETRFPRPLLWLGGLFALLLLLLVILSLLDWNALRGPLSRMISRDIERPVSITGNLRVHLFSWTPSVELEGLNIGNPDWVGKDNMVELPRLYVAVVLRDLLVGKLVLSTLELDNPKVELIQDEHGRANWDFGSTKPDSKRSAKPTKLPPLLHFALKGGSLAIDDAVRKLTFSGKVGAQENGGGHEAEPFKLNGDGTLNKEPFKLEFTGGALLDIKLDHPYEFQTAIYAGPSSVKIQGSIAKPFDFGGIDAEVELQGQNLANLYYLTNLALPLTPPYQISIHIHRAGNHFALDNLVGKIGSSDVRGKGAVDLAQQDGRPRLTADITSQSLNLADLGVAFGAGVEQPGEQKSKAPPQLKAPKAEPISPLLLPTFEFQFDRLRAMDAAVDFRADSIQAQKLPIKNVAFTLKLEQGDLNINPISFVLPEGQLAGNIELNTKNNTPETKIDIHLTDIRLDQFKSKNSTDAPLEGVMQGRLRIDGNGNSVHAIASDATGTFSVVLPQGQMREAFAELAGIDAVRGLGLLLTKKDQTVPIRCGVIEFQLKDGDAEAEHILFDTENVIVSGEGRITFADEKLDLNIKGEPKKLRFDRIRAPVNVRGTLRHPSISLSTPALAKQGAVASILGVVATPFAAVLAFVDPGLAKNADCASLTDEAGSKVAQPPPPNQSK
jgi:AsmA family protein